MCQLKYQPLAYSTLMIHPALYRVDDLTDEVRRMKLSLSSCSCHLVKTELSVHVLLMWLCIEFPEGISLLSGISFLCEIISLKSFFSFWEPCTKTIVLLKNIPGVCKYPSATE